MPGKEPVIGWRHKCPTCRSKNTYYSAFHQGWCCYDCGEVFQLEDVQQDTE